MKIAYLGPEGTFTEEALWQFAQRQAEVGRSLIPALAAEAVDPLPVQSPAEAAALVYRGEADAACLAIENSVDGYVTPTFDALAAYPFADGLQIYDELYLNIRFALLARPGVDLSAARTLSTHPVAYAQIRGWLAEHAPHLEFRAAASNGAAAAAVAQGEVDVAAAPLRAGDLYGLEVLASDLADMRDARTRFILLARKGAPQPPTGQDHTSVMFIVPNQPGSLAGALQEFTLRGVNLSRIESRPSACVVRADPQAAGVEQYGPYRFHIDLQGHIADPAVASALEALYLRSNLLCYLGSWPARSPLIDATSASESDALMQARAWVEQARGVS